MGLGIGKFLKKNALNLGLAAVTGGGSLGLTTLGKIGATAALGGASSLLGRRINKKSAADVDIPEVENILPGVTAISASERVANQQDAEALLDRALRGGASPAQIQEIMRANRTGAQRIASLSADRFLEAKGRMAEMKRMNALTEYNAQVQDARERRRNRLGNLAAVTEAASSLILDSGNQT